jgi:hypothetical protein
VYILKPAGKKASFRKSPAASHLVRFGQRINEALAMFRE